MSSSVNRSVTQQTRQQTSRQQTSRQQKQDKTLASVDLDLPSFSFTPLDYARLSELLLRWYGESGRDLPWRRTRDPYAIWVSEIMLQQTQVKTVLPYYDRWLKLFPDVQTLAAADLQVVLKAWEGLGYYARARNLHKAAQEVVVQFGGVFPQTLEETLTLTGIGRTTAGGILSSAFNLPLPIMDGNVKRVLARLLGLTVPPSQNLKNLWEVSSNLVPPTNGRDFNQALMDLGATVCTPQNPACLLCPWRQDCRAYALGTIAAIPVPEKKAAVSHKTIAIGLIWNELDEILIDLRPTQGLLGGLWEFPHVEVKSLRGLKTALSKGLQSDFGIAVRVQDELMQVHHAYTHFKMTFHLYECRYKSGAVQGKGFADWRWVRVADLGQFPFPKSHLKMIAGLTERSQQS